MKKILILALVTTTAFGAENPFADYLEKQSPTISRTDHETELKALKEESDVVGTDQVKQIQRNIAKINEIIDQQFAEKMIIRRGFLNPKKQWVRNPNYRPDDPNNQENPYLNEPKYVMDTLPDYLSDVEEYIEDNEIEDTPKKRLEIQLQKMRKIFPKR
jgi:hypothetical protein